MWSTTARADILEQYIYIAGSNPVAADQFAYDIESKLRSYASLGLTGVSREEFGPGIRSFAYRRRVIYFTLKDDVLFVSRILHGHQNISPEDFPESIP